MFETLCLLSLVLAGQQPGPVEIPVQSAVVSLMHDVELSFEVPGLVNQVHAQPGQVVRAGDLLVELDATDAELDLQRLDAEIAMATLKADNDLDIQLKTKALAVAKTELSRALKANEKFADTVSASEIDRLQLRLDEATLQIEQAKLDHKYQHLEVRLKEAERAILEQQLNKRELRAPRDGILVRIDLQPGERVQPGQAVCRLIDTETVRVEGFVSLSETTAKVGDKVVVSSSPEQRDQTVKILGNVTFVDPEIDSITKQYKIWAEIPNKELRLRPGQRPAMSIIKGAAETGSEPTVGINND